VQSQHVIADLKHYNVYNQETNRGNAQNSILTERALQEIYTRPWEDPVRAGLGSVMCSFNKINDIFACENAETLAGVLRQQLGFTGFVITDFGAIHSTVPSLVAGTDLETGTASFYDGPLLAAVRGGQVAEAYLNRSVLRILTTMFRLGLFDNTYGPGTIPVQRHGAVARRVEEQAVTLLKNAGNTLPLARGVKSVAVIGGDANIAAALGGASRVEPTYTVSLLQGIRARAGSGVAVRYAPGSDPVNAAAMLPGPQAVPSSVLATPDGQRGVRAEWFTNTTFEGVPAIVRTERQVNPDWGFLSTFAGLNPSQVPAPPASGPTASGSVRYAGTLTAPATGTYTFSLTGWGDAQMYLNGRLVVDMTGQNGVRSVTSAPMRLVAGQPNGLRITFAGTRPRTGLEPATLQLGWTHPANAVAPQIREAAAVARRSDVAIVLARLHEGEQRDRASLTLPNEQDLLIRQVRQANPKTVVVLATGGPITMPWLSRVPAVVQAYYGGQEQGNAIARALFGDVNPSGKLPITYPRSETAVPRCLRNPWATEPDPDVSYCEGVGVGYRGYELHGIRPLFPFGHGLSYTSFRYAGLSTGPTWRPGRPLRVSLTLANTGRRTGAEVVQIYAGRLPTAVRTPPKQLAGFTKVTLRPGQRTRVTVPLDVRSLSYWDGRSNRWVTPAGTVPIYAGGSSQDLRLAGTLRIGQRAAHG
jgi:beta-glucosidase